MFKSVFALAALAVAAPSLAQDTNAFNGPYVGIQGGWQQDRQVLRTTDGGIVGEATAKKDGFAYGGQIGYDFRLTPSTVLGAEVALTGKTGTGVFSDGVDSFDLRQGRTISATARLGYLVQPTGLLYVKGGYANARYTLRDAGLELSEDRDGYQIGAGYEQMLSRNVSARLEYAFSNFGKDDLPFVAAALNTDSAELKYKRHAVTAGVNFRF